MLVENLIHFGRTLRRAGLNVGSGRLLEAIAAVRQVGLRSREDFYWTLHATLVSRATDRPIFDQTFHIFWRNPRLLERMQSLVLPPDQVSDDSAEPIAQRIAEALADLSPPPDRNQDDSETEPERDAALTWSHVEQFASKDFASMSAAELDDARAAIARMRLTLPTVRLRRQELHTRGRQVNLRHTMRRSLRRGGATIELVRTRPRLRPAPLVILCDISGSMSSYARLLLHFAHALTNDRDRVFSFVFGTRLTHISRFLRQRDIDVALNEVGKQVLDWDGGTRIGACLHAFNRDWSRRVLASGAVVLLITDGLDRDAGEGLEHEMRRLQMSSAQLICLNPLLRYDGYEPRTRGMRAILPYVDELLSVHNLNSLRDLAAVLKDAPRQRELANRRGVQEWLSRMH